MTKTIAGAWRESTTLKFVLVGFLGVFSRYMAGGLDFGFGTIPVTSMGEFAAAFAAITGVWLGREWRAAHYQKD